MKITNVDGLSEPLFQALANNNYKKVGDYSASQLPQPPQSKLLEEKYDDQIVIDCIDRVWLLFGNDRHDTIGKCSVEGYIQEEQMQMNFNGFVLTGKPDAVDSLAIIGNKLIDYKTTSIWSFLLGDKFEWEAQLNIYAYILNKQYKLNITELRIEAILRDWRYGEWKSAIKKGSDYPPKPILKKDIPLWTEVEQELYISARIKLFEEAKAGNIPECSDKERWIRPQVFALMKKGAKNSKKNCKSREEAEQLLATESKFKGCFVEERPKQFVRCEPERKFCLASFWCPQYQAELKTQEKQKELVTNA